VALIEVYDTMLGSADGGRLVNLSTRGSVSDGNPLVAGVVISGSAAKKVLIRATGPALTDLGLGGALSDPKLSLFQGPTLVKENDNWAGDADIVAAAKSVGAFSLKPDSKDAALVLYLAPGNYTAQVTGVNGAAGIALVEVYEAP